LPNEHDPEADTKARLPFAMELLVTAAAITPSTGVLQTFDWLILGGYVVACLIIGAWAMRGIRDAGAYLLARRKLGKVMSLAATFAGGVNANDPVAVTSKVYANGVSGIWTALNFLLMTPWMWMRDPVGRRLRLVTGVDVMRLRFGRSLEWLALIVGVIGSVINLGLGIKAAALVTIGVAGGHESMALFSITGDPVRDALLIAAGMVVIPTLIYTVTGGIVAACATDVFMSGLIILLSFVAIPFAWTAVGGLPALRAGLPPGHLELISSSADFSMWGLFWFVVAWTFALGPGPSAAKDEMTARVGSLGMLFKRVCTLGWAALGLFGVLLYSAKHGLTPAMGDQVFARISAELLPTGLRGLMVAAILAAAMSTIAGMSLSFAGMALQNLYRPWLEWRHARQRHEPAAVATPVSEKDTRHYLFVARVLTVGILLLGWGLAAVDRSDIFTYFSNLALIGSLMGVCTLAAYMWRRVTTFGALASIFVMAPPVIIAFVGGDLSQPWQSGLDWLRVGWVGWLQTVESMYHACGAESVVLQRLDGMVTGGPLAIRFPAQLVPGLVALIVGSLVTRQHNARDVAEFYARLDTPVGDEHLLRERGIVVDLLQDLGSDADVTTRDPSRRLLMLDLLYLPWLLARGEVKLSDYKVDLIGAGALLLFVAGFIGGLLWLIGLLRPV
jgi:SSS family solute:Na+ symporter